MRAKRVYRPDIDGLRGIAVLSVLAYHFDAAILPGGYIGVDVFFVISGYLIAGIIADEVGDGRFSLRDFYVRRARRILPALLTVMIVLSVVASFVLLPSDLESFARSVIASLFSLSNFWFWQQTGYFNPAADDLPLLHTWSLGVEEQFYLLLPVGLILALRKGRRFAYAATAGIAAASLVASAAMAESSPDLVFFLTPFRVWELLLGVLLALGPPGPRSSTYARLEGIAGLAMIVVSTIVYSDATVFPGLAALLPCAGAALVIRSGSRGHGSAGPVTRLLSVRPLVLTGAISYSLYLWHWPLFAFQHYWAEPEPELIPRIGLTALAFVLSWCTWRLIETPFRNARSVPALRFGWIVGAGASVALLLAMGIVVRGGMPERFPRDIAAMDTDAQADLYRPECRHLWPDDATRGGCRIGADGPATVLYWGDSYAHAMLESVHTALANRGVAGVFIERNGCPPLPGTTVSFRGRVDDACSTFNARVVEWLAGNRDVRTVILAGAWVAYTEVGSYQLSGGSATGVEALSASLNRLVSGAAGLEGRRWIVLGQVPTYPGRVPRLVARARMGFGDPPVLSQQDWSAREEDVVRAIRAAESGGLVHYVDLAAHMCESGTCSHTSVDGPLYKDHGHLNETGSRFLAPFIESSLHRAMSDRWRELPRVE